MFINAPNVIKKQIFFTFVWKMNKIGCKILDLISVGNLLYQQKNYKRIYTTLNIEVFAIFQTINSVGSQYAQSSSPFLFVMSH